MATMSRNNISLTHRGVKFSGSDIMFMEGISIRDRDDGSLMGGTPTTVIVAQTLSDIYVNGIQHRGRHVQIRQDNEVLVDGKPTGIKANPKTESTKTAMPTEHDAKASVPASALVTPSPTKVESKGYTLGSSGSTTATTSGNDVLRLASAEREARHTNRASSVVVPNLTNARLVTGGRSVTLGTVTNSVVVSMFD